MKIVLTDLTGREYNELQLVEAAFTQTAGVACDSLQLYFKCSADIGEIRQVKAYSNDELIFNGYCDCQKITSSKNGVMCYLFARSTASVLVDNEALPFTYNCPTTKQLWYSLARERGFKNCLPDIACNDKYEVSKGTSCFGAISRFIELQSGGVMYVTPYNELKCLEESDEVKSLDELDVISKTQIINRSEPVTHICVKKSSRQSAYTLHMKSALGEKMGLERIKYLNLQSLPQWQRDYFALSSLKSSFSDYKAVEITACGFVPFSLYQRFMCDDGEYLLKEKKYIIDKNGHSTRLTLNKKINVKELTYVD